MLTLPAFQAWNVGKHLGEAYPGAHVLMMFRASTLADDIARMGGASTLGYIVKPVKRRPLLDAIIQACATPTELAPATLDESPSVGVAARILLVEDNPDNRLLIKAYLKKQPYEIVEAENGEEAINCYTSQVFDLVLMDVQMPVMDGYTATRAIRSWEREHDRPRTSIIALTANAIKEDMDKSIEAGCDVHLTKPIQKADLARCARRALRAQRAIRRRLNAAMRCCLGTTQRPRLTTSGCPPGVARMLPELRYCAAAHINYMKIIRFTRHPADRPAPAGGCASARTALAQRLLLRQEQGQERLRRDIPWSAVALFRTMKMELRALGTC